MRVKTRYIEKFKIDISTLCRIQKTLYMKALEYKTYFIHINCEQVLKSLEDGQGFALCNVLTPF
jgi:hypothetical protein